MRRRSFAFGLAVFIVLSLAPLLTSSAAPLRQLPNPLTVVSNEGQAGLNVDETLIRNSDIDPDPNWRDRFFDPSGWQNAYPVMRAPAWTSGTNIDPLLNAGADHVWGGTPGSFGPDAGNLTTYANREGVPGNYAYGYAIPTTPSPQYLFLYKSFCMPINAQADLTRKLTTGGGSVTVLNATDSGGDPDNWASIALNRIPLGTLPGDESDTTYNLPVVDEFLFRGRNALTIRVGDSRNDNMAAILYSAAFGYAIDPTAIQITPSTVLPFETETVNLNVTTDGLSDRTPFDYAWTFGDGDVGAGSSANHAYATAGSYTVTLTVADTDTCTGTATIPITVLPHPLTISKTATPDPVIAGETLHYSITVSNASPLRPLTNVIVTDTLPVSTTFDSCSDSCTVSGRTVQWSLGTMGTGGSRTLALDISVDRTAAGALTNAAYGARANEVSASGAPASVDILSPPLTPTLTLTDANPCDLAFAYNFSGADPDATGDLTATLTVTGAFGSPIIVAAHGSGLIVGNGTLTIPSCGLYTATLKIVDDEELSNTTAETIYVNERPHTPTLILTDTAPGDLAFDYGFSGTDCDVSGRVTATLVVPGATPSTVTVTGINSFSAAGLMDTAGCGTYTGTLTVVDDQGCIQAVQDQIFIAGATPQVNIDVITTALSCNSSAVTYTVVPTFNATCCAPMPYSLTFANGVTQTGVFPTSEISYAIPYDYRASCNQLTAAIVVACGCYTATDQVDFTLNQPPAINLLTITQTTPCAPDIGYAATLSDCNGLDSLSWRLDFSDGGTRSGSSNVAGSYMPVAPGHCGAITATLIITDDHGCVAARSSALADLNQPPEIYMAALSQADPCVPVVTYTAGFSDCNGDALAPWWTFYEDGAPVGTSTADAGAFAATPGFCGQVTATLEVSDGACVDTEIVAPAIDINLPPVIQTATLIRPDLCSDVITFTASAYDCDGSSLSYLWTFYEDGALITTHTVASGTYVPTPDFCGTITATLETRDGTCATIVTVAPTQPRAVYLPLILKGLTDDAPDTCHGWPLTIGEPIAEDFDHANDEDWFTFRATAGISYTIRTQDLEIRTDTVITLYDSTCINPLATNDDLPYPSNSRASQIGWRASATSDLHILVRNYEQATYYGPDTGYSLVVYDETNPPPPIADAPDFCPAAYDLPIGRLYTEDFDHTNDNDWFAFDVSAGRTYTITTSGLAARANTVLELWGSDCSTLLAQNDDINYPTNLASQIVWTADGAGQLFIKVRQYNWTIYGLDTGYTVVVEE